MITKVRKTLPKLSIDNDKRNRNKFYSNKIVLNESIQISEKKNITDESHEIQKLSYTSTNLGKEQSVLSDRNKRIMSLYKRVEKDSEAVPKKIKFLKSTSMNDEGQ